MEADGRQPGKCNCKMPLKSVWLVGCDKNDVFADVYANREDAVATVMAYIFDPYWFNKLITNHQKMLEKLKDDPELAIAFYNEVADSEEQWHMIEAVVRYEPSNAELPPGHEVSTESCKAK